MTAQIRPLSGMVDANGNAEPQVISNTAPTTVHQLGLLSVQQGGPFVDSVTLFVQNTTAGDLDVTVHMPLATGTVNIVQTIKSKVTAAVVLADVPMFVTPGTAVANALITAQGSGAGLVFWGSFTRK